MAVKAPEDPQGHLFVAMQARVLGDPPYKKITTNFRLRCVNCKREIIKAPSGTGPWLIMGYRRVGEPVPQFDQTVDKCHWPVSKVPLGFAFEH